MSKPRVRENWNIAYRLIFLDSTGAGTRRGDLKNRIERVASHCTSGGNKS